jgi:hypothetical protein
MEYDVRWKKVPVVIPRTGYLELVRLLEKGAEYPYKNDRVTANAESKRLRVEFCRRVLARQPDDMSAFELDPRIHMR